MSKLTHEQRAWMARGLRQQTAVQDFERRENKLNGFDALALGSADNAEMYTAAADALEAEGGKDSEIAELRKRIETLEDELETEQEDTAKEAAFWEKDCARALARLTALTGFKPDLDGDTADVMGEHVEECYRQATGEAESLTKERDGLKNAYENEAKWRKAYQEGKGKLYELGGVIADAAMAHLPCNEAGVDRFFRQHYVTTAAAQQVRKNSELLNWLLESIDGTGLRVGKLLHEWPGEDSFLDYCRVAKEAGNAK